MEHSAEILKDGALAYRWRSMGELLAALEAGGLLVNAALLVGHGTLRQAVMGNSAAPPSRVSDGKARILLNTYSGVDAHDEPLRAVLSHPLCAFETDAILTRRGQHNPASFGTFPRVLGHYSRDVGLFRLEEAVRRMTSLPAERIGLRDVGRIVPGHWADLVVFDPATVADNTTPRRADAPPSGIRAVLITGEVVAQDGALTSKTRQGRLLRR
ncbi:amidohydrolase family protein [Sorangium sp. KYC3313]|uniref:amidohydrolase family protein n=1 Tax=Sorangium sp. KYC3313 TaxID=3449740 RepID=UPI003F88B103